eukprot:11803537-Prorocentrum_lima.AAC.1
MTSSLVGSEMCIRDRLNVAPEQGHQPRSAEAGGQGEPTIGSQPGVHRPVSYTHLTLPTICSV